MTLAVRILFVALDDDVGAIDAEKERVRDFRENDGSTVFVSTCGVAESDVTVGVTVGLIIGQHNTAEE